MCLILINISPNRATKEILQASYEINKDGAGVAYNFNNQVIIKKGFANFEEFFTFYSEIPPESNIMVHHRLISAGNNENDNLHPFEIAENELVFSHNGSIKQYMFKDSKQSDSLIFGNIVLKEFYKMDKEFYKKPFLKRILEEHVGTSKIVFMDSAGNFTIWNEGLGEWNIEKTMWTSNVLYKKKVPAPTLLGKKLVRYKKQDSYNHQPNYFLNTSGTPPNLKKKYFLRGDQLYHELSLDELDSLTKQHRRGIHKLIKKGIIGKLSSVPSDDLKAAEELRYEEFLKKSIVFNGVLTGEIKVETEKKQENPAIQVPNVSQALLNPLQNPVLKNEYFEKWQREQMEKIK